jgi:hypothetical protein
MNPLTTSEPGEALDWSSVDACTLPTAERPLRLAEIDELFATALRRVERPRAGDTRARLVLVGDDGLADRVQLLADAESACCSFFTFGVSTLEDPATARSVERSDADQVAVAFDVEVPTPYADVLDGLVDRAEAVLRGER